MEWSRLQPAPIIKTFIKLNALINKKKEKTVMEGSDMKDLVVGVDLGGTNVRAGLVINGKILKVEKALVPAQAVNASEVVDVIIETIGKVFTEDVIGIGIGIPSLLNRKEGVVYDVQNIPSWKEVHLKELLEAKFQVPVTLDNDANCFAIGERIYGKGVDCEDFVGLTLGTGMGSGIIKNGTLMPDENCGSGEFGSVPYQESIYEDYCSGKFFQTSAGLKGEDLFERADKGDVQATNLFNEFGKHVARAIQLVMYAVDPKMVIIGGSIAHSRKFYQDALNKELKKFPYSRSIENLEIEFSELDQPAILGASALVVDALKK